MINVERHWNFLLSSRHIFGRVLTIFLPLATNFAVSGAVFSSETKTVSQNDCSGVKKGSMSKKPQELEIMNGMLKVVNGNFLVFERNGVSVEASVKQPDYGYVTGLGLAANGEVYAIGDHRFYEVTLAATTDGVVLEASALPVLYRESCGWFGTLFGTCQEENAIFSDAVSAVFLSGYDARGDLKSYVYGLTGEVLDLSSTPSPHYQRDCGMGSVVMVGESAVSILDKSCGLQPYDSK